MVGGTRGLTILSSWGTSTSQLTVMHLGKFRLDKARALAESEFLVPAVMLSLGFTFLRHCHKASVEVQSRHAVYLGLSCASVAMCFNPPFSMQIIAMVTHVFMSTTRLTSRWMSSDASGERGLLMIGMGTCGELLLQLSLVLLPITDCCICLRFWFRVCHATNVACAVSLP